MPTGASGRSLTAIGGTSEGFCNRIRVAYGNPLRRLRLVRVEEQDMNRTKGLCNLNAKIAESYVDRFMKQAADADMGSYERHNGIKLAGFWSERACEWYRLERECEQ